MKVEAIKTDIFKENQSLIKFIKIYIKKIPENSVLVITSKILSLAQGRTSIINSNSDKEKLVKKESDFWARRPSGILITIKNGLAVSSAGLDESNANGKIIMLPLNAFEEANKIRKKLQKIYKVKNLGIIISDSRSISLRAGIIGLALAYAGFKALKKYHHTKDLFGRSFKYSRTNVADSLAAAAVLVMGEGAEQQPLALITDLNIEFSEKINKKELIIDIKEDMFLPIFEKWFKIKKRLTK